MTGLEEAADKDLTPGKSWGPYGWVPRIPPPAYAPEGEDGGDVQRVGLTLEEAEDTVRRFAIEGAIPEPLRVAHLIAGAVAEGQSRGRG